jgi:hypothetical protein
MDRRFGLYVLLVCLGAALATAGWCQNAGNTSVPVYAEVRLPVDGQNTLYLGMVASEPGGPRDLVYADKNCNGELEESECLQARVQALPNSPNLILTFAPIMLKVPQGEQGPSLDCILTIQSSVTRNTLRPLTQNFTYALAFRMRGDGDTFTYTAVGVLQVGPDAQQPPQSGPAGGANMKLEARPDTKVPGNTALGVTLDWGGARLSGRVGAEGFPARVVLTNRSGRVVRDDQTDTSKAAFG